VIRRYKMFGIIRSLVQFRGGVSEGLEPVEDLGNC
jgi:hypothetical protein